MNKGVQQKQKTKYTRRSMSKRGSMAIEGLIVMFITLMLAFTGIGMVYSLTLETALVGEMQKTASIMSVTMAAPLDPENTIMRASSEMVLKVWGTTSLKAALEDQTLITNINSNKSFMDNEGIFTWQVDYSIHLPMLTLKKTFAIPIKGVSFGGDVATSDQTVYITRTGECFHMGDCTYLSKSKIKTTLEDAEAFGYRACSKCKPKQKLVETDFTEGDD